MLAWDTFVAAFLNRSQGTITVLGRIQLLLWPVTGFQGSLVGSDCVSDYMPPLGAEFQGDRSRSSIQATHFLPNRTSAKNRISTVVLKPVCTQNGRSLIVTLRSSVGKEFYFRETHKGLDGPHCESGNIILLLLDRDAKWSLKSSQNAKR